MTTTLLIAYSLAEILRTQYPKYQIKTKNYCQPVIIIDTDHKQIGIYFDQDNITMWEQYDIKFVEYANPEMLDQIVRQIDEYLTG